MRATREFRYESGNEILTCAEKEIGNEERQDAEGEFTRSDEYERCGRGNAADGSSKPAGAS